MNPAKKITELPEIVKNEISIPIIPSLPGISGVLSLLITEAKKAGNDFISNNVKEGTTNYQDVISYKDKLESNMMAKGINEQGKAATMTELTFTAPNGPVTVTPITP